MADQFEATNQRIAELLSYGVPEEEIYSHLSKSKDPTHQQIVRNYSTQKASEDAAARGADISGSDSTVIGTSALSKWVSQNPIETTAIGAATLGAAGLAASAIHQRIKSNAEIRTAKELAKIEPSAAVKVQQDQLALQQQKLEFDKEKFAASERAKAIADSKPTAPATEVKTPTLSDLQNRAALGSGQPVPPNAPTTPVQAAAPAPVQAPVATAPAQSVAPSVAQTVETGGNVGQAVKEVVAKELDQATSVAPKTRAPKTEQFTYKAVPEGHVFIPEMGNLDQGMQNIYGEEGRKYARDLLNEGKHFGTSANYNQDLKKLSTAYMTALQGQIPETLLSREERIAQGVPHGGQGTFGKLGKLAKVGGVVGTLMTVAEAAKAKTAQDRALAGANVIGSVLPPGADILEAGAPTLSPELRAKQEEFAMLGSPFYNTQEAKNLRQAKKVGGGRGIAPPSAYMR